MCYLAALGRCTTLQECWSMQVPGRAWGQIICMRSILSVKFIDFGINWMVRSMWLAIVRISTLLVEAKRKTNWKSLEISEWLRFEVNEPCICRDLLQEHCGLFKALQRQIFEMGTCWERMRRLLTWHLWHNRNNHCRWEVEKRFQSMRLILQSLFLLRPRS
jgi:hypothetical protein